MALVCCASPARAQGDGGEKGSVPPGMKKEKVGDLQILVPKDAEVKRMGKGGLVQVEKSEEYLARKLAELEERLVKMEKAQEAMNKDMDKLKDAMGTLKNKRMLTSD